MSRNSSLPRGDLRYSPRPILLAVLMASTVSGCASTGTDGRVFDYAVPAANGAALTKPEENGETEKLKDKSASALLAAYQTGPGYVVQPTVSSNGRYNVYTFKTDYGTYLVTGDELARNHIRELIALDALKKRSEAMEFAHGVGNAVTNPVKAVVTTVKDPTGAVKASYSNTKRRVESVQRGLSRAGEFVTTFGHPPKRQPDREDDSLLQEIIGVPEAKRRLAKVLKVDPYTHFKPLANELDKVASYSAVGEFSIDTAVGFVSGPAGTVISSLQTLDSFTERTLNMDPGEAAAINRKSMKVLSISEGTINELLLSDKLTPTEKTLAVGYLSSLSGTSGLGKLASFIAKSDTRFGAYAALQTLRYLSGHPTMDRHIRKVEIIAGVPVLTVDDRKRVAIFTSDDLFWTRQNADQLSKLSDVLTGIKEGKIEREIRISGTASPLAKRQLRRRGWLVMTNAFN